MGRHQCCALPHASLVLLLSRALSRALSLYKVAELVVAVPAAPHERTALASRQGEENAAPGREAASPLRHQGHQPASGCPTSVTDGHDSASQQQPFVATSKGMDSVAQMLGMRMRDAATVNRMDRRWQESQRAAAGEGAKVAGSGSRSRSRSSLDDDTWGQQTDGPSKNTLLKQWAMLTGKKDAGRPQGSGSLGSSWDRNPDPNELPPYMMYMLNDEQDGSDSSGSSSRAGTEDKSAKTYRAPLSLAQHIREEIQRGHGQQAAVSVSTHPKNAHRLPAHDSPTLADTDDGAPPTRYPRPPESRDDTLQLLLPLLVLLSTLLFLLILFIILVIFVKRRTRIALSDGGGPLDVGREEELEGHGGLDGIEERWLETVDDATRRGYLRAKDWSLSFPPGSFSSEITLSQFLTIQEKGVSAWSFDPDYESNPSVYVEGRTEITFLADGEGMAPQEGGGCSVQSNLPLPKLNEVYYWEAKMFTKPDNTSIAVGLATKPFPGFRMPGWSKYSVGFFSADGFKCHNYPFAAQSYGPEFLQGDVIGVGYRPRSGTVFFTRNGRKLEDAFVGLNRYNLFPTIGANGAAEVHVNLGQAGFVFIEANVKKWGLAPMVGTLAPPPPYGMERGSILIETGQGTSSEQQQQQAQQPPLQTRPLRPPPRDVTPPPPPTPPSEIDNSSTSPSTSVRSNRARARRHNQALPSRHSGLPVDLLTGNDSPPSPGHASGQSAIHIRRSGSLSSSDEPHNPPTPHHMDISMHSLDGHGDDGGLETAQSALRATSTARARRHGAASSQSRTPVGGALNIASYFPQLMNGASPSDRRSPSPPPYLDARHTWSRSGGGHGGDSARPTLHDGGAHRSGSSSVRAPSFANALFGALSERGLLTPMSAHGQQAARSRGSPAGEGPPPPPPQQRGQTWLASWFR